MLNRNPDNYFAAVEQAAFAPSSVVPGLSCSPDPMLQGRLFAYADAHRYRLGVNHHQIPVNRPVNSLVTYHRDGAARVDGNAGATPVYHPNSFDGVETSVAAAVPAAALSGDQARHEQRLDTDYYSQGGELFRLMNERKLLTDNIAAATVGVPAPLQSRQLEHFSQADPEYGERVRTALARLT